MGELSRRAKSDIALDGWTGCLAVEHLRYDLEGLLRIWDAHGETTACLLTNGEEFTCCCLAKQLLVKFGIEVERASTPCFLIR